MSAMQKAMLWFDVEQRYKTTGALSFASYYSCGLM